MSAPAAWAYRPALDGMRAVAVTLVVVYHAGVPSASGGFVGVDVFFVLSGFLITNLLLVELDHDGTIRLRRFYARRIRRLLPAAVVMVVVTALAAGLVETAASRAAFVSDARHALVYVANWHFLAGTTDYFAADVEASPFLHFWSLAIEEQFYVVYPIAVVGVVRFGHRFSRPRALLPALAVVGAASLAAQWVVAGDDPLGAYFSTFTRLYQLLAGAMLAVVLRQQRATIERFAGRGLPSGGVALGGTLAVVLLATPWLDVSVSARGIFATFAAVVTVASLDLAPHAPLARVLGRDPIAYLGRISYGTYLWHWPIVVFTRRALAITPIETAFIAGVGGTALAALSAQVIEAPIRRAPRLDARPLATIAAGLAVSAAVAFVVAPHVLGSNRRPALAQSGPTLVSSDPHVAALLAATPPDVSPVGAGAIAGKREGCTVADPDGCLLHRGSGAHIHVMGDSNASVLVPVLVELAVAHDLTLSWTTWPGCPWQRGLVWDTDDQRALDACVATRDDWYDELIPVLDPDVILATSVPRDPGSRSTKLWRPVDAGDDGATAGALVARTTAAALDELLVGDRRVVLLEPLPYATFDPAACLTGASTVGACAYQAPDLVFPTERAYRSEAIRRPNVFSADYDRIACPHWPLCIPAIDGHLVFFNQYHLDDLWLRSHADDLWRLIIGSGALAP